MKMRFIFFQQTFPDLQHGSLLEDTVNCCCVTGMSSPVRSVTPEVEQGIADHKLFVTEVLAPF